MIYSKFRALISDAIQVAENTICLSLAALIKKSLRQRKLLILPPADGWNGNTGFSYGDEMLMLGLLKGTPDTFTDITAISMTQKAETSKKFYAFTINIKWLSRACPHRRKAL